MVRSSSVVVAYVAGTISFCAFSHFVQHRFPVNCVLHRMVRSNGLLWRGVFFWCGGLPSCDNRRGATDLAVVSLLSFWVLSATEISEGRAAACASSERKIEERGELFPSIAIVGGGGASNMAQEALMDEPVPRLPSSDIEIRENKMEEEHKLTGVLGGLNIYIYIYT